MSFDAVRQWAYNHPIPCVTPMVLLVVLAVVAGFRASRGPVPVAYDLKLYFFDEDTGETVLRTDKDIPPLIGAKGQPSVVRAIYMAPEGAKEKTLVYLIKYTDEAKAALDEAVRKNGFLDGLTARGYERGCLVRKPAPDSPWMPTASEEGQALMNSFQAEHRNVRVRFANP